MSALFSFLLRNIGLQDLNSLEDGRKDYTNLTLLVQPFTMTEQWQNASWSNLVLTGGLVASLKSSIVRTRSKLVSSYAFVLTLLHEKDSRGDYSLITLLTKYEPHSGIILCFLSRLL
jgi:hypothetical protein